MKTNAIVEHSIPGYKWADPVEGQYFSVKVSGTDLEVIGKYPTFSTEADDYDIVKQFGRFSQQFAIADNTKERSPGPDFANAKTDKDLIAFVKRFGPVVARQVKMVQSKSVVPYISAKQDMEELRCEQRIFQAALTLVECMKDDHPDEEILVDLIRTIAEGIEVWQIQWERQRSEIHPYSATWELREESLARIRELPTLKGTLHKRDVFLNTCVLDGRVVICELLNAFRPLIFPNASEGNLYFRYGIRPLLFSTLRHHFLYPQYLGICQNPTCRKFYKITRAEKIYHQETCSRKHRQRLYWEKVWWPAP